LIRWVKRNKHVNEDITRFNNVIS